MASNLVDLTNAISDLVTVVQAEESRVDALIANLSSQTPNLDDAVAQLTQLKATINGFHATPPVDTGSSSASSDSSVVA